MASVDRILKLCTEKGVSVARCERECGFSNGYLRKMQGKDVPAGKLQAVAEYFGVSLSFLATGKDAPETHREDTTAGAGPRFSRQVWELLVEAEKATGDDVDAATAMLRRINTYRETIEKLEKG